ncbi:MAG: hypothetical protein H8E12_10475 [Rhodobacteraceae bacterium]|nr:hypothetical protein [Paracoccaceae bacterium]
MKSKTLLTEFVEKYVGIENERKLLGEDRKILIADYKDKLDVKAVQAAMRIVKMRSTLDISDDEFDNMLLALDRITVV